MARFARLLITPAALAILAGLCTTASAQNTGMSLRAQPAHAETPANQPAPQGDHEQDWRPQAQMMLSKAQSFMRARQHESGGWSVRDGAPTFPAITALTVIGFMDGPKAAPSTVDPADPAMQKALDFMLSKQQPNGGIYDQILPSYNSTICLSALTRYPDPRAKDGASKALQFLRTLQWSESAQNQADLTDAAKAIGPEHSSYGGVGYGRHGRPDLSNTSFFVEALHDAGVEHDDPAFQRALLFLQRTQMLDATDQPGNDMEYADGSTQGGFIYAPSPNKDRLGEGSSPAGEIVESLSGGPGTIAKIDLGMGEDNKPRLMTRDQIKTAVMNALSSMDGWPKDAQPVVVMGATADNASAQTYEIRTPIQDATQLAQALTPAFTNATIRVESTPEWQGISRLRAYGSMTYAGFKSLIYAGLSKNDPRVDAAMKWIEQNYTVDENPGLGTDGYYYYLVAFSKALNAAEMDTVAGRNWRSDLVTKLTSLQNDDGSFRPVDDRWMETDPELITAYSMIALQHALR